jgi:hypothetical protein
MPEWRDDDWSEEIDDLDEIGEDGVEADDEAETVPCPYCRRRIFEDAVRCPYCERYLSDLDAPPARKPWWIIVGAVACLYAIYRWILG